MFWLSFTRSGSGNTGRVLITGHKDKHNKSFNFLIITHLAFYLDDLENFIDQKEKFVCQLIQWYEENHRKLPWRETKDPYKIWLSEIILQQTRVAQGLDYYNKFTSKYPQVTDLAEAEEEEVLKDWQGLGYYSRARNLHYSAKMIVNEHEGEFPNTYKAIRSLKGVGDYTAAAIASFAFQLDHAVVDGNVFRLLSRYFGIKEAIDSTKGKKLFSSLAEELLPKGNAAEYNQAIMEFGALQCKPLNPNCSECPLKSQCFAFHQKQVEKLPFKEKKIKQKDRYLHYFIIRCKDELLLNKRSNKDIWQNLFDFPSLESDRLLSRKKMVKNEEFHELFKGSNHTFEGESMRRKHLLSHQRLNCKFFHFSVEQFSDQMKKDYLVVKRSKLAEFPIPKLVENYLGEETNLLSLFGN